MKNIKRIISIVAALLVIAVGPITASAARTQSGTIGGYYTSAGDANSTIYYNTGYVDIGANAPAKATLYVQGYSGSATSTFIVASSSGTASFTINPNGNLLQLGDYSKFGSVTCNASLIGMGQGLELCGSNSSDIQGVQIQSSNNATGTAAFGGFTINNNLADSSITHFAGFYLNSSNYTSTTFGTAIGVPNLALLQNTDGPLAIIASTSTSAGYISFLVGGTATETERARILPSGFVGIGTTTPITTLQVATTTANATTTLTVGKAGQSKGSCLELYRNDGSVIYAYVGAGTTAFTLTTTSCK